MKPHPLLVGGIVAAAALTFVGAGVVRLRTNLATDAMKQEVTALTAQLAERNTHRQPLWGEATEGQAFEHYRRSQELARALYQGVDGADDELRNSLTLTDAEVAGQTAELRRRWRPVREALRKGAHSLDRNRRGQTGVSPDHVEDLLAARWACNACVLEAKALRHAGHDREAVEWTLDAATFGADLHASGLLINQMIGTAMIVIATDWAWSDEALEQLDPDAIALLASGLARLDEGLDPNLDMSGELAFMARHLGRVGSAHDKIAEQMGKSAAWSYGFSTRWMAADAFLQFRAHVRELEQARGSWPERKAVIERMTEQCSDTNNAFLAIMVPNVTSAERNLRMGVAQVRMLRVATATLRGEALVLEDPLGSGAFSITRAEDEVQVTSAGESKGEPLSRTVKLR